MFRFLGEVLESVVIVVSFRDEVLCEGRSGVVGLLGFVWLFFVIFSEFYFTVYGGFSRGEVGFSVVFVVKSWLCLRIRTVIRCCIRDVFVKKMGRERFGCVLCLV